jgi:hypothetical protein
MFQTLVLRPAVEFLINKSGITSALGGIGSLFSGGAQAGVAGASGGGFGGGSILSGLSGIGDLFTSGNNALIGSIESLGAFLSNGQGGLGDILGGALGQYSSQIANILPFAGSAFSLLTGDIKGAISSGLGAALSFTPLGPVGGIVGSLLGSALGSLFGGGGPPKFSSGVSTSFENGKSTSRRFEAGYAELGSVDFLTKLNESFTGILGTVFKEFGLNSNIGVQSSLIQAGKSADANFFANIDGQATSIQLKKQGRVVGELAQQLADQVLGKGLVDALKVSKLPEGVKSFFDNLVKQEDIVAAINTLITLKSQLKELPPVFDSIRNALNTNSYKQSLSEIQKQFNDTSIFTSLFYTQQEQFTTFTNQLKSQLKDLNQVLPTSRDEYRALVDSFKVTDEASSKLFGGLVALAPAMDTYFKQLEAQANGINQVNRALADGLDRNLYSTFADLRSAYASTDQGVDASQFMANNPTDSNFSLALEVKGLREQGANQQTVLEAIATYLYSMEKIQKRWNGDGLPAERVI